MCGFAGFLRSTAVPNRDAHREWLENMGQAIIHRGPDAGGVFLDDHVGLVHRRLSIIDLSDAGTQPMKSASGRYIIAFNGEIYNFREIRKELEAEGRIFTTGTDTEVLLQLFERKGFRCLDDLNGMFALAIWDTRTQELFLARDRLGKKPLYYYEAGGHFAFASEIKALLKLPFLQRQVRPDAIKDFFAYQYIPDPKTIYTNVHKLPPGYWLKTNGKNTELHQYWDVSFAPAVPRNIQDIEEGLYELIEDAVRLRMISDVPLGAFLSGGVDSSAIVGLMAGQSERPVTTCSIGFDSEQFDEVKYAQQVARQFKTDHHEFTVRENVADNLAGIARFFDEPFADPSFVPTYFVSQLARQKVTVALAGDGGDENFAGYSKYRTDQVENRLRCLFPGPFRRSIFPGMAQIAGSVNNPIFRKAQSLLGTLALEPDQAFFRTNCFFRQNVWDNLVRGKFKQDTEGYDPAGITRQHYHQADSEDHLGRILYTDIKTYLPGDILVKVDRMSMANSLETRAPLLDYRVVEYAAQIPSALKLHGKEKKYALKKAFSKMLPDDILYRKKMGFSVPLADWLRNEIRPIAETLLLNPESGLSQYFDRQGIEKLWLKHQNGDSQYTQELWSLLAFELWWQQYEGAY
ncbi:asparagine synthase (glutamine-hydrolyzing) [Marinobacter salsuginis]|uniref:asparagine synthase (glutamine-hydrolyzing) n=1 Tax=Marinobacter salsuginis TaxID=418719 RepID=UPI001C981298|nr:asparagine synthase (glutamine-hydrolyzing) [Marinobacter salsuginis]MBY6070318.1 asparagine synthase (glutamine-hydrolyzing) [Marinobacter salsuginis]